MITTIKSILEVIHVRIYLFFRKKRYVLAFDLPSIEESQFFSSILSRYIDKNPRDLILIVHHRDTKKEFNTIFSELAGKIFHLKNESLRFSIIPEIDLFLTTEQNNLGLEGTYSIALFHGQPSKGLTFNRKILESFDAFFLYGELHRDSLEEYLHETKIPLPVHLELFNIGYPKSDNVINGLFSAKEILQKLSLDPSQKTILYAPAFNEGASLREYGLQIIELLASLFIYNIVVKLPIDCWEPINNFYATGGIDWFQQIRELERKYPKNLKLFSDYHIDPLLSCSDVLITCISSVSFEFFALNKPVVFIETPKFFNEYLKQRFPHKDTISWSHRTTINGGKEFGLVISDIHELPQAIKRVLENSFEFPYQQERLKNYLLYNKGKATEVAVKKIEELLKNKVTSQRQTNKKTLHRRIISGLWDISGNRIITSFSSCLSRFFIYFGYTLQRTGEGFLDSKSIINSAGNSGLTICEYLESLEFDIRKHGRRNRIIQCLDNNNIFFHCQVVLEIGAGTGMYLEKVFDLAKPLRYEIYETNFGWMNYLKKRYSDSKDCKFFFQQTDGETLKNTVTGSCNLVHAHAVFVYIPILKIFSYIKESSRVLVPGGFLVFDCLLDIKWKKEDIENWMDSSWRFPIILPYNLLIEFTQRYNLELVHQFDEIYGASMSNYLVFKKNQ